MTGLIQNDIFLGVIAFTLAINLMVIVILVSRKFLIASGDIEIQLNEDPNRTLTVSAGDKLLQTLANAKTCSYHLPVVEREHVHNVNA